MAKIPKFSKTELIFALISLIFGMVSYFIGELCIWGTW
jgi:hypothetical protein